MASFDFEQAYDEHAWRVYGFFAQRLPSRADAEDLTQLTFERALGAWDKFDPARASVATWLFAIARNLLIDHHRAAAARPRHGASWETLDSASEPRFDGPEQRLSVPLDLSDALATLTEREREVLALRFGADFSGPEIAASMGLTLANVQQIVSRALRKLRAQLEGEAQNASGPAPAAAAAARPSSSSPHTK